MCVIYFVEMYLAGQVPLFFSNGLFPELTPMLKVYYMGLDATKPVFGISEKTRLKQVSSATGTGQKIEILLVASLEIMLFNKQITKALIRLRGCPGWSAAVLFANLLKQVFSLRGPYIIIYYYKVLCVQRMYLICLHKCTTKFLVYLHFFFC